MVRGFESVGRNVGEGRRGVNVPDYRRLGGVRGGGWEGGWEGGVRKGGGGGSIGRALGIKRG